MKLRKEYLNVAACDTPVLLQSPDEVLNSLIYEMFVYVNMGATNFEKNSPVCLPTLYIIM